MGMKSKLAFRILIACYVVFQLATSVVLAAEPERVIAIGDVHGAFTEFLAILQRVGLIDGNRQWTGGTTTLIQTGDIFDRGPQVRDCLDLLIELERQAQKQKGRVIALFGNHEIMNIMGDLRYVTPEIYAGFTTEKSEEVRDRAYRDYVQFLSVHRSHGHPKDAEGETARQNWIKDHPLGYFEYRDALGPRGKYGRWLREHHTIVQVGDGLFLHGGLNPQLQFRSVDALDKQVRSELENFDSIWQILSEKNVIWRYMELQQASQQVYGELKLPHEYTDIEEREVRSAMRSLLGINSWMAVSSEGPVWYRGLALDPEDTLAGALEKMLARLKARYIVNGHNVSSKSDIIARFNNRVFLIDTGMLHKAYDGRPSALEIQDGRFTAYFADGEPKALAVPPARSERPSDAPDSRNLLDW